MPRYLNEIGRSWVRLWTAKDELSQNLDFRKPNLPRIMSTPLYMHLKNSYDQHCLVDLENMCKMYLEMGGHFV